MVVVPKEIDDATLQQVALFRQNGRFPVLSYFHKENSVGAAPFCRLDLTCKLQRNNAVDEAFKMYLKEVLGSIL